MTTKVMIVNFGPDVVHVETLAKAAAGFVISDNASLAPQEGRDFWVHQGQALRVQETPR